MLKGAHSATASKERAKPKTEKMDKVETWRYDRLVAAGYTETQALMLALKREIDLHKAEKLASEAGPRLAYAILA